MSEAIQAEKTLWSTSPAAYAASARPGRMMRLPADQLAQISSSAEPVIAPAMADATSSTVAGSERRAGDSTATARATATPRAPNTASPSARPAAPASTRASTTSPTIRLRGHGEAATSRERSGRSVRGISAASTRRR
nr:hypothetical protein [Streptomyces sp. NBC_00287]